MESVCFGAWTWVASARSLKDAHCPASWEWKGWVKMEISIIRQDDYSWKYCLLDIDNRVCMDLLLSIRVQGVKLHLLQASPLNAINLLLAYATKNFTPTQCNKRLWIENQKVLFTVCMFILSRCKYFNFVKAACRVLGPVFTEWFKSRSKIQDKVWKLGQGK